MKKQLSVIIVLAICLLSTQSILAQEKSTIAANVSVKEFNKLIATKPGIILDVRTPGEVAKGVIKQSVNIDFFDDNFQSKVNKLDKNKPVYVYCASGGRSGEAMEIMKKDGFKEVYNLSGGYNAWIKDQKK